MGEDLELQKNVIGKACHGDCMSYKDASFCAFVSQVSLEDIPIEDSYGTIFSQYEEVIVQALVSSFGLDFLIQDQHGGDVDTIHNVREIGKDPEMRYKNQQNSKYYANRGDYNTGEYHGDYRNGERTNFAKAKHKKKMNILKMVIKILKMNILAKQIWDF